MALIDDINALPTTVGDGNTGHLNNHQVIHAALKAHEAGLSARHLISRGFPEGKVAAPVGATYVDEAATSGAIRWIKTSGTGASGWVVEYGDTGWRSIDPTPGGTVRSGAGKILVKRHNQRVIWRFEDLGLTDGTGADIIVLSSEFRSGFSPYAIGPVFHVSHRTGAASTSKLKVSSSLYWIGLDSGTALSQSRTNVELRGEISYNTDDPWPYTLPGTPA